MQWFLIFPGYFLWHYTLAFRDIWHVWMNTFWAVQNFFSIPLMLSTLFSPWKRIIETEGKQFDLEDWAERKVVNLLSRLIGAIIRTSVLCVGIMFLIITFTLGIFLYIFWILAPLCIVLLFLSGVYLLF